MRRAILFAVLAAAASLAAYWLALHPGQISIQWLGYRLEPPIGLLVLAVLGINVFGDGVRDALDPRAEVRIEH